MVREGLGLGAGVHQVQRRQAPQAAGPAVESNYGTPVKDRVATIGLLNKRNNLTQDLQMKPGESRRVGNVIVKLATCERTLPWGKRSRCSRPSPARTFGRTTVARSWFFRLRNLLDGSMLTFQRATS